MKNIAKRREVLHNLSTIAKATLIYCINSLAKTYNFVRTEIIINGVMIYLL
jgi:hypothetical protein